MIKMKVLGLTLDSASNSPILILQEENGNEILPLWIGAMEAMAISLTLSGINVRRPLTHDLMLLTMQALKANLHGVEITDLREGAYLADLLLVQGDTLFRIDCRPSDAIALALRASAPISVSADVLRMAREARNIGSADGDTPAGMDTATGMVRTAAEGLMKTEAVAWDHPLKPDEPDNPEEQDKKLMELLKNLEPESKRRM